MFKRKVKFDIEKIQQKLNAGNKAERMFVYTVQQNSGDRAFVLSDYKKQREQCDLQQVDYFCKMLEGCGFNV